jgi:hypothetical protein
MQDFGRELQAQRGLRLQMRLGLNTGLVVVARLARPAHGLHGGGRHHQPGGTAATTGTAGTMVISAATHKLVVGYFETRDLGEHTVKGHTEPERVYEVLRARGRRTRLEVAAERGLTPRVGRDRELTTLLDLFQQAKAGHGQVVSITGKPALASRASCWNAVMP